MLSCPTARKLTFCLLYLFVRPFGDVNSALLAFCVLRQSEGSPEEALQIGKGSKHTLKLARDTQKYKNHGDMSRAPVMLTLASH
jgi:hypothetical protein